MVENPFNFKYKIYCNTHAAWEYWETLNPLPECPITPTDAVVVASLSGGCQDPIFDYRNRRKITLIDWVTGLGGFANIPTIAEKYIVCRYCAYVDVNDKINSAGIIGFYIGEGMSQADATNLHLSEMADHQEKNVLTAEYRSSYKTINLIVFKNLATEDNAEAFVVRLQVLTANYKSALIQGTNFGDSQNGIMDWIYSTSNYVGNGLQEALYTYNTNMSYLTFQADLESWLIDGVDPL